MNYKEIQKQFGAKKGKIVWLASYPKSGNTWMRAFITSLFYGELDINQLLGDNVFTSAKVFEKFSGLDPTYLSVTQISKYRPLLVDKIVKSSEADRLLISKIHDAFQPPPYSYVNHNNTQAIIYIVRNPLAIAASLANHMRYSLDESVNSLNRNLILGVNPGQKFSEQILQQIGIWSDHVSSWIDNEVFPVHLVRYEDLLDRPVEEFSKITTHLGLDVAPSFLQKAINLSNFSALQQQENEKDHFKEKRSIDKMDVFFRKGKSDSWQTELSKEQHNLIISNHAEMMSRLKYLKF